MKCLSKLSSLNIDEVQQKNQWQLLSWILEQITTSQLHLASESLSHILHKSWSSFEYIWFMARKRHKIFSLSSQYFHERPETNTSTADLFHTCGINSSYPAVIAVPVVLCGFSFSPPNVALKQKSTFVFDK